MPKKIKQIFHFKTSAIENLAVGTTMIKIWYWKSFIRNYNAERKIHFQDNSTHTNYFK